MFEDIVETARASLLVLDSDLRVLLAAVHCTLVRWAGRDVNAPERMWSLRQNKLVSCTLSCYSA